MCCSANYVTKTKRSYTGSESRLKSDVKAFMENPDCGSDAYNNLKRDMGGMDFVGLSLEEYNHTSGLHRRFDTKPYESMRGLMLEVGFTLVAGEAAIEIWNKHVASVYKNFALSKLQPWLKKNPEWKEDGMVDCSALMICNMDIFDYKIGGEKSEISRKFPYSTCCPDGGATCGGEDLDGEQDTGSLEARTLEKRAGPRTFRLRFREGDRMSWQSLPYRSRGEWAIGHRIWRQAFTYRNEDEFLDSALGTQMITTEAGRDDYDVEHYVELNTIQGFLTDGYAGALSTGARPRNSALPRPLLEALNTPMLRVAPPMAGGLASTTPLVRVMNALGSRRNDQHFMVLLDGLNSLKSRMWRDETRFANMSGQIEADNPNEALRTIRSVITVMNYLNDDRVRPHMVETSDEVRREFGLVDQQWVADGNEAVYVQYWWDQWFRDRLRHIGTTNTNWATGQIADMRRLWAVKTGSNVTPTIEALDKLNADVSNMKIDTDDLD